MHILGRRDDSLQNAFLKTASILDKIENREQRPYRNDYKNNNMAAY
jgi:hypothetical protein